MINRYALQVQRYTFIWAYTCRVCLNGFTGQAETLKKKKKKSTSPTIKKSFFSLLSRSHYYYNVISSHA